MARLLYLRVRAIAAEDGKKHFMGKNSALDVAIRSSSVPSSAARSTFTRFEREAHILVPNGKANWEEMRKRDITEKDRYSAMREMAKRNGKY